MFQNSKFKTCPREASGIQNSSNGFTLIESIVGLSIFLLIFLTLYSLFGVVFGSIKNNKAKDAAKNIALEELEIIRSINFDDVKTSGGGWYPPGKIPSERFYSIAGTRFTIQVDVAFVDDPYDSLDETNPDRIDPPDDFSDDYKKARVRVLWTNTVTRHLESVAMSTNIAPKGLEGLALGKGGLKITTYNASGEIVPFVDINITSESLGVDIDTGTDLNGNLWALELDPANDYHIIAAEAGFNSDQTYAVNEDSDSSAYNPNPIKPDAVIIEGKVTKVGLAVDLTGNINIKTVNYDNPQNYRINTDSNTDNQTDVTMDIDANGNVYFVWIDGGSTRFSAQKYRYNNSGEFEKQWTNDIDISGHNRKRYPRIKVFGTSSFYVVGTDDRNSNDDVFLGKYSSDGSIIWNGKKINVGGNPNSQTYPDLAIDSSENIYIAWKDNRNGNYDIYAQKINSSGNAQWGSDLLVNSDAGSVNQTNPRIVVDNDNNFYVVWTDERNGNQDIYWMKFDPDGNKFGGVGEFGTVDRKINEAGSLFDQYEPAIDFDGINYFYISWSDKRNSQPDIYAQKYDKNGNIATTGDWVAGDVKINDDSLSDAWRKKSSVAYFSDNVIYFSWEDDRNIATPTDVFSAKFDSNGVKLWAHDLIMNSNASGIQGAPEIVVDLAGFAITSWNDSRNGNSDIYATRYDSLENFTRSAVSIIVTGTKLRGTYPPSDSPIYKNLPGLVFESYPNCWTGHMEGCKITTDGAGNYTLTGVEWGNYNFVASPGNNIISFDQPIPLEILPGDTKTIILNME